MAGDYDNPTIDESEQLDQLQPDDTLIDRGVDDVLDEGYISPDRWSPAQGYGNTADEQHRGETLDQRMNQEQPDAASEDDDDEWNSNGEPREVGARRAGRLVGAMGGFDGTDTESEVIGFDVGFDGGAASAEEAAMHIIDVEDDDIIE